jgi:hypothetical protein
MRASRFVRLAAAVAGEGPQPTAARIRGFDACRVW